MAIEFGTWPEKYALGEKMFVALYKGSGYSDSDINMRLNDHKNRIAMGEYQRKGEEFLKLLDGSHGAGSNALFGPIDRSKENTERMHAITLSMGADTGKHEHTANAYNAAAVPLYVLQNTDDGTYVLTSGGRTKILNDARHYTDRSEAESHRLSRQTIVEI